MIELHLSKGNIKDEKSSEENYLSNYNRNRMNRNTIVIKDDANVKEINFEDLKRNNKLKIVELGDSPELKTELKHFLINSLPYAFLYLLVYSFPIVNLLIIQSRYNNSNILDAAVYTHFFLNIFPFALLNGFNMGYEIFTSNAMGAKKFDLLEKYFFKAQFINLFASGILIGLCFASIPLLNQAMMLNQYILSYYHNYFYVIVFTVFLYSHWFILFKYLNILKHNSFLLLITSIGFVFNLAFCLLFVLYNDYALGGSAFAQLIGNIALILGSYFYIWNVNPNNKKSENLDLSVVKGIMQYLKYCLPFIEGNCVNSWGKEVIQFLCLFSSHEIFSSLSIIIWISYFFNLLSSVFSTPLSLILVSYISKRYYKSASMLFQIYLSIVLGLIIVVFVISLTLCANLASLLLNDNTILTLISEHYILVSITISVCVLSSSLKAIMYGINKQKEILIVNLITNIMIQPLFTVIFGLVLKGGIKGFLIPIILGNLISAVVIIYYIYKINMLNLTSNFLHTLHNSERQEDSEKSSKETSKSTIQEDISLIKISREKIE